MLLFVEGPDKAGKTTLIKEMSLYGIECFSLRYPLTLFEDHEDIRPVDYFLGANTFLVEVYKQMAKRGEMNDFAVHRGFISEFVYGPLFGRAPDERLTRWWIEQWPESVAMIHVNIPHHIYIQRATGDAEPDTIPLMAPARWKAIQDRYQMAIDMLISMDKRVVRVSGEALFEDQWSAICTVLPIEMWTA